MVELFANIGDLDQTPHSDVGLHCLPITLSRVSRLQWFKFFLKGRLSQCNNYSRLMFLKLHANSGSAVKYFRYWRLSLISFNAA